MSVVDFVSPNLGVGCRLCVAYFRERQSTLSRCRLSVGVDILTCYLIRIRKLSIISDSLPCSYAAEGLRTLVFAMREISPEDFKEVDQLMVDCQNAINDREAKEQLAFQSIEDKLCCIGVTGVEDRLN